MSDPTSQSPEKAFPFSLKIAAAYLVLSGAIGLIWPLTGLGPHAAEFQAKSMAYKIGAYSAGTFFSLFFIIAGTGIFLRKSWARRMALLFIVFSTIYSMNSFAWGLAGGKPSARVDAVSTIVVVLWNSLWLFLIYRYKPASTLVPGDTTAGPPPETEPGLPGYSAERLGLDMESHESPVAREEENTETSVDTSHTHIGAGRALVIFLVFELSQLVTGLLLGIAVGIYATVIDRAHAGETAARMQGALNVVASFCGTLLGGGIAFRMVSRYFRAMPRSEAKDQIGWRGASKGYGLWGAWCGLIFALLYLSLGSALFPPNPDQGGPLTAAASTPGWPRHVWAMLAVLIAPIIEEFVFRGILFSGLSHSWGPLIGGAVTTLLFTGLHMASFTPYWPSLLSICFLGLATLTIRIRSQSLVPGMAMHSAYNLVLVASVYAQCG